MEQYGLRGSFRGFTYNNIHSSTLGITRVSDGSRFNQNLVPSVKETTINLEGVDGQTYFGTKYTKRDISVSFVFQHLTKARYLKLKSFCKGKEIHDLIFDEEPYKVYSAKITGQMMMKYLSFGDNNQQYYNGEGSVTFTCYFPYARSRYAWQEEYNLENIPEWRVDEEFYDDWNTGEYGNIYYDFDSQSQNLDACLDGALSQFNWVLPTSLILDSGHLLDETSTNNSKILLHQYEDSPYVNKNEWLGASNIKSRQGYGTVDSNGQIKLFNSGDLSMPTRLWFKVPHILSPKDYNITLDATHFIKLRSLRRVDTIGNEGTGADEFFVIDMPNNMVVGYDVEMRPTGRVYNSFLTNDSTFFALPTGESIITCQSRTASSSESSPMSAEYLTQIQFNYLYL